MFIINILVIFLIQFLFGFFLIYYTFGVLLLLLKTIFLLNGNIKNFEKLPAELKGFLSQNVILETDWRRAFINALFIDYSFRAAFFKKILKCLSTFKNIFKALIIFSILCICLLLLSLVVYIAFKIITQNPDALQYIQKQIQKL